MRAIIFAAVAAASLSACGGAVGPVSSDYESLPADQVLEDVEHLMTNAGVRQSLLKSDTTLIFDDSATVQLRGVNLEIFTETGRLHATLTSRSGVLDRNTNKMVARDDVVLVIHDGPNASTIRTAELHYDPQQRQVWSDVFTERILPGGRRATMQSFRVDDQFGNFQTVGYEGPAGNLRF